MVCNILCIYMYILHNFSFKWKTKNAEERVSTDFFIFVYIYMFPKESPHFRESRTVGACVWTTEDLAKDPSAWEHREATLKKLWIVVVALGKVGHTWNGGWKNGMKRKIYRCFRKWWVSPKWWYPTTLGFPTKNDHICIPWDSNPIKRMGGFI